MELQLLRTTVSQDRSITPSLRVVQHHWLSKQLEAIDLLHCAFRRLDILENNECLSLGLQVCFRDNINDVSVFGEDLEQRILELIDFNPFLEVADLEKGQKMAANMCHQLFGGSVRGRKKGGIQT
jgi:hypothetical protein